MDIRSKIAQGLLSIGAVFLRPQEPFTWASGIKSPIYCDNRLILTAPAVRDTVERAIADTVRREFPQAEVLMGTATAGIAHAAIAAHLLGLPMGYVRSGSKDHGRKNQIEGRLEAGQRVVVVEDLISTGGSVLDTVAALREAGAEVLGVGDIIDNPAEYAHKCDGKILAPLFFEPSTRTRLSFESAMLSLGGKVLGFSEAKSSSAAKGESVADTVRTVSCYSDIIAMRHPKEGAPLVASMHSLVPVINAGDGGHNHPTQTLTDLLTIHREMGRFENLTVGLCGDLKFGRTVHSLVSAMSRYPGVRFVLISPEELKLPRYVKEQYIKAKNIPYTQSTDLEAVMPELDILYMTRVQRERFFNEEDYLRLKDSYILTPDKLKGAKEALRILHPLPRVNEISVAVDDDPRACYFKQVQYGKYIRMALILKLLEIK